MVLVSDVATVKSVNGAVMSVAHFMLVCEHPYTVVGGAVSTLDVRRYVERRVRTPVVTFNVIGSCHVAIVRR